MPASLAYERMEIVMEQSEFQKWLQQLQEEEERERGERLFQKLMGVMPGDLGGLIEKVKLNNYDREWLKSCNVKWEA